MTDIAIVAAVRTPMGSFRGAFAPLSAVDLGAAVVRGLLERCQLPAAADRLHRLLNRFQPGAAHQIDGDRRSVDRQAGPQRGLARRVLPAAGGKHLAEN